MTIMDKDCYFIWLSRWRMDQALRDNLAYSIDQFGSLWLLWDRSELLSYEFGTVQECIAKMEELQRAV